MKGSSILCILNRFDMVHHGFITNTRPLLSLSCFKNPVDSFNEIFPHHCIEVASKSIEVDSHWTASGSCLLLALLGSFPSWLQR